MATDHDAQVEAGGLVAPDIVGFPVSAGLLVGEVRAAEAARGHAVRRDLRARAASVECSVAFLLSDCYPNCCQEQVVAAPDQVADSGCGRPTVDQVVRPKHQAVDMPEDVHLVARVRQLGSVDHWSVDLSIMRGAP